MFLESESDRSKYIMYLLRDDSCHMNTEDSSLNDQYEKQKKNVMRDFKRKK